jgi:hypothetical protein
VLSLLAIPAFGGDGGTEFFPDTSVTLRGARYVNDTPDFQETAWIGAGAGVVRSLETTLYLTAEVQTVIGDVIRNIDPNQANYHLEFGFDHPFAKGRRLNLFFHHVSRHLIDLPNTETVSWNVLGLRGETPLGFMPGRVVASVGHTTHDNYPGYGWEFIARVEGEVLPHRTSGPYYSGGARVVTTTPSAIYSRSGFLDGFVEGGWRFSKGDRKLDLFLSYQHENDAAILVPGARDSVLLGFHISAGPTREPWCWR